jgi:predicted nucleic-acid-binding Zn-ribbon protein
MGKTACKDKKYEPPKEPRFICKKCGVTARKEKEICKPQNLLSDFLRLSSMDFRSLSILDFKKV